MIYNINCIVVYQCKMCHRKGSYLMKTYGIICEYNPFHNGHIYQIEETKRITGADHIVAVMSGNYVQRGDLALVDKFARAQVAVNHGVDLVIEIPVQYSLSSAEFFARCGVMTLKSLRCVDGISFGSECGSIEDLKMCADTVDAVSTTDNIKPLLEQGMSYPEAISQLVAYQAGPLTAKLLDSPNNTLGIEYLRAIKALGIEDMDAVTVKRKGPAHDGDAPVDGIASATYIRRLIDDGEDFSEYVPEDMKAIIDDYDDKELLCWFENLERAILYRMRTISIPDLKTTAGVGQGLENRIFQAGHVACSLEQLISLIKTKRYPEARVRRIILNTLIGIKNEDIRVAPVFGRILALNDRGAEIIRMAGSLPESKFCFPFSTSYREVAKSPNKRIQRTMALNNLASDIYTMASRTSRPGGMDFTVPVRLQKIEGFVSELRDDLPTTSVTPEIRAQQEAAAKAAAEEVPEIEVVSEETVEAEEKVTE